MHPPEPSVRAGSQPAGIDPARIDPARIDPARIDPARIDLSDIGVIDNHCHAVESSQQTDISRWRRRFTESPDPNLQTHDVVHTAFYHRLIRAMAQFHGVPPTEDAVLQARSAYSAENLVARLFRDAAIDGVVVDTGYPAPGRAMPVDMFTAAGGSQYRALLRLELAFQDLIAKHSSYLELLDAVRAVASGARGAGFVGFKSIAAYRTGLGIQRWEEEAARASYGRARIEVGTKGTVRLGYKPLLDTLLHLAFEVAAEQEMPVQFHVGYGDPDVDLRTASPLLLREVFEEPAYRPMPVVMLHGCWPYFREGAYLASVYGNAYLDLSYAIPFLSGGELSSMTRAALGAAPFTKLMYSSDGVGIPELHWMGAHAARRILGDVLGELVTDGDLDTDQAYRAGELILRVNAHTLYGFGSSNPA